MGLAFSSTPAKKTAKLTSQFKDLNNSLEAFLKKREKGTLTDEDQNILFQYFLKKKSIK